MKLVNIKKTILKLNR